MTGLDEFHVDTNAAEVSANFGRYLRDARRNVRRAVETHGLLLETRIKAKASRPASGPPGPRAITGDYRASWNSRLVMQTPDVSTIRVGTNKPQARRLELGFAGRDALGRVYNQPPYPHVRPAAEEGADPFRRALLEAIKP